MQQSTTQTCLHLDIVVGAAAGRSADGEGDEVHLDCASVAHIDRPRTVGVVWIVVRMVRAH